MKKSSWSFSLYMMDAGGNLATIIFDRCEKISFEELVCIEPIEDLQVTYTILDMKMSKLFEEVLEELQAGIIPILETRILLRALINEPFTNEIEGMNFIKMIIHNRILLNLED